MKKWPSSLSTQQWQVGSTGRPPSWNRKEWHQRRNIEARNRDTWTATWRAAWLWAWRQLKRGRLYVSGRKNSSAQLTRTVKRTCNGSESNTNRECTEYKTSSLSAQRNSQKQTTDRPCRNAEVWQIFGTWMTVTSCATQRWSSPVSRFLTQPTLKLLRRGNDKKQKSFATSQIWTTDPEWRIADVRTLATVATRRWRWAHAGASQINSRQKQTSSTKTGGSCGPRSVSLFQLGNISRLLCHWFLTKLTTTLDRQRSESGSMKHLGSKPHRCVKGTR